MHVSRTGDDPCLARTDGLLVIRTCALVPSMAFTTLLRTQPDAINPVALTLPDPEQRRRTCKYELATFSRDSLSLTLDSSFLSDPPGPPEISGYIEGETIRLGQTVSLVCTASGGNPLAKLTWHRNNELVDESHTTSGRESRNTYSFVATTEDDGARYRCQAKNDLSAQPSSADIVLAVQCKSALRIALIADDV